MNKGANGCGTRAVARGGAAASAEQSARQVADETLQACERILPGPAGFCRVAAELMCLRMLAAGVADAQVVTGDYDHPRYDNEGHVWVEAQGLRFDTRATQFHPDAPLVSALDDPRYSVWEVDDDLHEDRVTPTPEAVAEMIGTMLAWNQPGYAEPLIRLTHALGLPLALVEPFLTEELEGVEDSPEDDARRETWTRLQAELAPDPAPEA